MQKKKGGRGERKKRGKGKKFAKRGEKAPSAREKRDGTKGSVGGNRVSHCPRKGLPSSREDWGIKPNAEKNEKSGKTAFCRDRLERRKSRPSGRGKIPKKTRKKKASLIDRGKIRPQQKKHNQNPGKSIPRVHQHQRGSPIGGQEGGVLRVERNPPISGKKKKGPMRRSAVPSSVGRSTKENPRC